MKNLVYFLALLLLFFTHGCGDYNSRPEDNDHSKLYKEFLIAFITQDQETVEKLCIPRENIGILFRDPPLPKEKQDFIIAAIKKERYRIVKIGEFVEFPTGRSFVYSETHKQNGIEMIIGMDDPMPHTLRIFDGTLKVDPGDLIEMREKGPGSKSTTSL